MKDNQTPDSLVTTDYVIVRTVNKKFPLLDGSSLAEASELARQAAISEGYQVLKLKPFEDPYRERVSDLWSFSMTVKPKFTGRTIPGCSICEEILSNNITPTSHYPDFHCEDGHRPHCVCDICRD